MPEITSYAVDDMTKAATSVKAGRYGFKEAYVQSTNGTKYELLDKISKITVYENIDNPFLTASIEVIDSVNIPYVANLVGGEKLSFTIVDHYLKERTFNFVVNKIGNQIQVSASASAYVIHAVSPLAIKASLKRLQLAYDDDPASILQDILHSELDFDTSKFFYRTSDFRLTCIIPNWRSLHSLRWISSRARSKKFDESPWRIFADIDDNLYHLPLTFLYAQKPYMTLKRLTGKSLDMSGPERYSFREFNFVNNLDVIDGLVKGRYKSTTQINFTTSREDKLDVFDAVDSEKQLGSKPVVLGGGYFIGKDDHPNIAIIPATMASFDDTEAGSETYQSASKIRMKNLELQNFVVEIALPGSTEYRIAQVFNVEIPLFANLHGRIDGIDERISGKYITTQIAHVFDNDSEYTVSMKLQKDAWQ